MDIDVYVKNNTLYFDYGYVVVGDIYRIIEKLDEILVDLPRPFQSISLYERAIEKNSLPTPDDSEGIRAFSDYLEQNGRDLSVWVLPGDNLLFRSLHKIAKNRDSVRIARSVAEAEDIISDHRIT